MPKNTTSEFRPAQLREPLVASSSRPISESEPVVQSWGLLVFGILGTALAGGLMWWVGLRLPAETRAARDWIATPCRITQSEIETDRDRYGLASYKPRIRYAFHFRGHDYEGKRVALSAGFDLYSDAQTLLVKYPAGRETLCFVNPDFPPDAVLNRELRVDPLLASFIPFLAGAEVWMIRLAFGRRGRRWFRPTRSQRALDSIARLRRDTALSILGGLACGALAAWVLTPVWRDLRGGGVPIIHLAYGAALLAGTGWLLWRALRGAAVLTYALPRLVVHPQTPMPGSTMAIVWGLRGGWRRLPAFAVTLEGREAAMVASSVHTEVGAVRSEEEKKETFAALPLAEVRDGATAGEFAVQLPAFMMPSFLGRRMRIEWVLRVASPGAWPPLDLEFPIFVPPPPAVSR